MPAPKIRNLPREAVERRSELYEKSDSDYQLKWFRNMMISARMHGDQIFDPSWDERHLAARIKVAAMESELFVITEDMMDLAKHASQSLPPQALLNVDLPSPSGYMLFEKPLLSLDIRGKANPVSAIMWREEIIGHGSEVGIDVNGKPIPKVTEGVIIYQFIDNLDDGARPPWLERKNLALIPRDSLYNIQTIAYGRMTWDAFPEDRANARQIMDEWNAMSSSHDGMIVEENEEEGYYILETASGHRIKAIPDETVQFLKTAWHLMQSELSDNTREYPPKRTAKGLPKEIPNSPVTIVRLRRRKSAHGDSGKWSLSYRYLRRGHWRAQWYGSGEHRYQRQIYILPTIVGPDDGPFVDRNVVNIWDR